MALLILVRHAETDPSEKRPRSDWDLSVVGRARNVLLAPLVGDFQPAVVVSSNERPSVETARTLAAALDLNMHSAGGVEDRQPSEQNSDALDRFDDAVLALRKTYREENLILVTGGVVIAGWLARHCGADAESTEASMGHPSFVVVEHSDHAVLKVVTGV